MNIISAMGFIVVCAVLSVLFKQYKPEYTVYINIVSGAVILLFVIGFVTEPLFKIHDALQKAGLSSDYFYILLKCLGICYITSFIGDLCKDSGQTSLEGKVYLIGKSAVFVMSFSLLENLFNVAVSFL